jgi:murein DD-endopeptidase MepM/ murein hydrolase activator NlpD
MRVLVIASLVSAALAGCVSGARVISGFGERQDGEGRPRNSPHTGVDIWGHPGSPVLASADGRVSVVDEEPTGMPNPTCGKYIILEHEDVVVREMKLNARTKYCHLAEHSVVEGATVKRGQVIGSIGTTGWRRTPQQVTGYEHVHWELIVWNFAENPLLITTGCFDPKQTYPSEKFVLTYPVRC